MRVFLLLCAVCGLGLTILPPLLFFADAARLPWSHQLMTIGMVLWFGGVIPGVMRRKAPP